MQADGPPAAAGAALGEVRPGRLGYRANYVSSIGACLALSALGAVLLRWARPLAIGAAVLLAVSAGLVRWERMDLWSRAGADAAAALQEVADRRVVPGQPLVFGPEPIQEENIAAFADSSNVNALVELAQREREVGARLSYEPSDFAQVPPPMRVDLCALSSLPRRDECGG